MKCSLDFPSSYWLAKIGCKIAVIALTTILLLPSSLRAQVKKVPFPFSPIGLNCLPWFVAKEARIFDKYAIEFDPVFIGASSALFNAMLSGSGRFGGVGRSGGDLQHFYRAAISSISPRWFRALHGRSW